MDEEDFEEDEEVEVDEVLVAGVEEEEDEPYERFTPSARSLNSV